MFSLSEMERKLITKTFILTIKGESPFKIQKKVMDMENRADNITKIEKSIFKAAIGYEYEESEIKANKKDNTTEVKKVKKHKQPDVRAAIDYLNLFCE